MRRGRPRHDDILTPREWQVLDLLREDLTNEQIAGRLGISPDTAKFHVSEILSKLGMQSRREAAAWRGQPRVAFGFAPVLGLFRESAPRHLAAMAIGIAAVGLVALAAGVVISRMRDSSVATAAPTATQVTAAGPTATPPGPGVPSAPDGRTGNATVDAIIDDFLKEDAAMLAAAYERRTFRSTNRSSGSRRKPGPRASPLRSFAGSMPSSGKTPDTTSISR